MNFFFCLISEGYIRIATRHFSKEIKLFQKVYGVQKFIFIVLVFSILIFTI